MTTTARLRRRLDKIAGPDEDEDPLPDISVLNGAQQDRVHELLPRFVDGQASDAEVSELLALFDLCPPEGPEGPREPPIVVPWSLERYWRLTHRNASVRILPPGNYYFYHLKLADCERLMELCMSYGWEPDSEDVDIAPIDEWNNEDYEELWALLASAVSPEERRYRNRMHADNAPVNLRATKSDWPSRAEGEAPKEPRPNSKKGMKP